MPLNSSGPISLGGTTAGESINLELGQSATQTVSLNDTNVRSLANVSVGAITMPTDFWGKSAGINKAYFFYNNNTWPTGSSFGPIPIISYQNDVLLYDSEISTVNPYSGLTVTGTTLIFYKLNMQSDSIVAQNAVSNSTTTGAAIATVGARLFPANNYFWTYGQARNSTNSGTAPTRSRWNWTTLAYETGQIWSSALGFAGGCDVGFFNADESGMATMEMSNDIGWLVTFNSAGARTQVTRLYGSSTNTAFSSTRCQRAADGTVYVQGRGGTTPQRLTRHANGNTDTVLNSFSLATFTFTLSSTVSTTPSAYIAFSNVTNVASIRSFNNTLTTVNWGYDINGANLSADGVLNPVTILADSNQNLYLYCSKSSTSTPSAVGAYICKISPTGTLLWQKHVRLSLPAPFTSGTTPAMRMLTEDEKQILFTNGNMLLSLDSNGNIPAGTFTTTVLGNTVTIVVSNVSLTFTPSTTNPGTTTTISGGGIAITDYSQGTWSTQSGLNVGDGTLNIS